MKEDLFLFVWLKCQSNTKENEECPEFPLPLVLLWYMFGFQVNYQVSYVMLCTSKSDIVWGFVCRNNIYFSWSKTGIVMHLVLTRYLLRRYSSTPSVKYDLIALTHLRFSNVILDTVHMNFNVVLPIYGFRHSGLLANMLWLPVLDSRGIYECGTCSGIAGLD